MSGWDFAAVVLATGAIIEVWQKGSIFALSRAIIQAHNDAAKPGTREQLITELLLCPFCQSYHVPLYLLILLFVGDFFGGIASGVIRVILYGLAATRASNLIEAYLPSGTKYGD